MKLNSSTNTFGNDNFAAIDAISVSEASNKNSVKLMFWKSTRAHTTTCLQAIQQEIQMFCRTRSSSYKSRSAATLVGSSTLGLLGQRKRHGGLQDRDSSQA